VPLLETEKALAKKRQSTGGKNGRNLQLGLAPDDAKLEFSAFKGKATAAVAKKVGVSTRTFERGKKILEKASEEDKQQLREGKTSISRVYNDVVAVKKGVKQTTTEDYAKLTTTSAVVNAERSEQNKLAVLSILKSLLENELFCPLCGNTMLECSKCHKTLQELLKEDTETSK
jgi:hypothetical protein